MLKKVRQKLEVLKKEALIKKEEEERQKNKEIETKNKIRENLKCGNKAVFNGKTVETTEEIDRETYGIIIPKNQIMLLQILVPIEVGQNKLSTTKINYSGPRARVKIAKGLSYNFGSSNISRKKELTFSSKGIGELFITSKQIIHNGQNSVTKIPLNKIIEFYIDNGDFIIKKETGNPIVIKLRSSELSEFVEIVLNKAINNL